MHLSRCFPLSFGQQRLWLLDKMAPGTPLYNVAWAFRLEGKIEVHALAYAFDRIVERHEALRTIFDEVDAELCQRIVPFSSVPMPVVDLSGLTPQRRSHVAKRLRRYETERPFHLQRGPLFRVMLFRLAEDRYDTAVTAHHIVFDGWSVELFNQELVEVYNSYLSGSSPNLPELPIQYVDFANWQRDWFQGDALEQQLAYWRKQLRDLPPLLDLPTDRPRPAVQGIRGSHRHYDVAEDVTARLQKVTRDKGTTLFNTVLAALKIVLYRHCNQADLPVGIPVAGRNRVEIEKLIGFFVNTLVLRSDLSDNPTFSELLKEVTRVNFEALGHQDVPFEKLVEELAPERTLKQTPLFQVMASQVTSADDDGLELTGLTVTPLEIENRIAKFDMTCISGVMKRGMKIGIEYRVDLFDATTIDRMVAHWQTAMSAVGHDPEVRVDDVPLMKAAERHQVLIEWCNAGTAANRQNDRVYVLGQSGQRQPIGVFGELHLAGEEITEDDLDGKLSRTGEMVRWLPDGRLEYRQPEREELAEGDLAQAPEETGLAAPFSATEETLAQMYTNLIGIPQVGRDDNFFDVGGHSLLALQLLSRIREKFHVEIPLQRFFEAPTVGRLAMVIEQMAAAGDSSAAAPSIQRVSRETDLYESVLVEIQPSGSGVPVFCLHPVSGSVLCYRELASQLGPDHPVFGLQAPYPGELPRQFEKLEQMAEAYAGIVRRARESGPYTLFGWSHGGVLAFEMARHLSQRDEASSLELLALLDPTPPGLLQEWGEEIPKTALLVMFGTHLGGLAGKNFEPMMEELQELEPEEQWDYLLLRLRIAKALPPNMEPAQLQRLFETFKMNIRLLQHYTPQPYTGATALFLPEDSLAIVGEVWPQLIDGPLDVLSTPGDHFGSLSSPNVEVLAQKLKEVLAVAAGA